MLATAAKCPVLIIEDHQDTADLLRWHLKRRGLEAEVVTSPADALSFLDSHRPRCLIIDEMLPGMSGLQFFRQLLALSHDTPIPAVFYSALFDWRKQMEAEALGAKGWYVKGVSRLADLMDRVSSLCSD